MLGVGFGNPSGQNGAGGNPAFALAGLAIATALGLVNGLLVGVLNLPSLAVTLGTMAAYSGLAFVVLSGEDWERLRKAAGPLPESPKLQRGT